MDNRTRDDKDKKEIRRQYILTAPLLPLLVKMAIPTIIGMLVTLIYNLTDTFFIGMLGNKSMTAAIGIAFSFISVIQAIMAAVMLCQEVWEKVRMRTQKFFLLQQ